MTSTMARWFAPLLGIHALGLVMLFGAPASAQTAAQKCLWVDPPGPSSTTTYTPWTVTDVGLIWDTETRTCCEEWNGPAVWYTEISTRTCTPSIGIGIGPNGASGTAGLAYPKSISVVNPVNGLGTASRYTRQERCLFTSNTVVGVNQTFNVDKYTHQALYNQWTNANVTFDGAIVPFGSAIDLLDVGLGQHQYVVTRTQGNLTDTFTFNIDVLPSYYFEFVGPGTTVNPSRIARFYNDSPDAIMVEFSTVSSMTGVETNLGTDNVVIVPAQGSYDVQLDLYTATGYVVAPGQVPAGTINATFGDANGVLLARFESLSITSVDKPSLVPFAVSAPYPNPSRDGSVAFDVGLTRDEAVTLELYDPAGRRIALRGPESFSAGSHRIAWSPQLPGPGVYLVRVRTESGTAGRRWIVLKE